MAKEFVLSAVLEMRDRMTATIKSATSGLKGLKGGVESVKTSGLQSELRKAGSAADVLGKQANALKSQLDGVAGVHSITISATDNATGTAQRATSAVRQYSAQGVKNVNLRAEDSASSVVTRLRERLQELTGKAYNVNINARQTGAAGAGLMSKLGGAASGVAGGMLMNTGMQMAGAAGIGYGMYDMVKSAANFEQGMSAVQAISGATGDALQQLTDKALLMGQQTKFTATESAQALNYMAMAGWKTDEMLAGLPGVMNLAAASGEDLAMVSDIVTDSMTAFGVPAEQSGHFADVLAAASANANTNVGMMGYTFKYAGAMAGSLGYSIEDVALAAGAMADSGVKADQAGTSLRAIMQRMAKPTKESAAAMAELGISAFDAAGEARPFGEVLDDIREKWKGLTGQDKARLGAELAGTEGSAGFPGMMKVTDEKWAQIKDAVNNADGTAEEQARIRMDNLSGSLTLLGSAWESFSIKIMKDSGAAKGLRSFVDEGTRLVTNLTKRIDDGGLTVKAVFDTLGEGLGDLTQKFLAFDGVGSVLAGGALAFGLAKIVGLTKRAADGISSVLGRKGATSAAGSMAGRSAVGDMVVNAATVVVNGQNVTGGAGAPAGGPATTTGGTAAASRSILREIAPGAAVAGALAVTSYLTTRSQNENDLKDATSYLNDATQHLETLQQQGAPQEQIEQAQSEVARLTQYMQDVQTQNDARTNEAVAQGFGMTAGTAVGGVLGSLAGPIGTQIGMVAGGISGEQAGKQIGDYLNAVDHATPETVKDIDQIAMRYDEYDMAGLGMEEESPYGIQAQLLAPTPENIQDVVNQTQAGIAEVDLTAFDENSGTGLFGDDYAGGESSIPFIQSIRDWINGQPFAGLSEQFNEESTAIVTDGSATSTSLAEAFAQANADTESAWEDTPGWFDADVYSPIESDASACGPGIADGINAGIGLIEGAWQGVRGFFSGLFSDIQSGAASAIQAANSAITAAAQDRVEERTYTEGEIGSDWTGATSFVPAYAVGGLTSIPSFSNGGVASFSVANVAHGLAQINEHGGELIDLPQGSRIYPAATTERLIQQQIESEAQSAPNINITGNTFTVREEADIAKIAHAIAQQIMQAQVNYGGAY